MSTEQSGSPPFCFLIPLQSEQVSASWQRVTGLLEMSLASIFHQTSDNFLVFVACHEIPEVSFAGDPRLRFCPVDYPAPKLETATYDDRMQDKWDKLLRLMYEIGKIECSHFMIVDADDLVNFELVEFAQRHPASNGWMIKHGYRYSAGSHWILEQCGTFNCGTNSIIKASHVVYPQALTTEERMKCMALTAGHTTIEKTMAEKNMPLDILPFPGAVYLVDHLENSSNLDNPRSWKRLLRRSYWKTLIRDSRGGRWHLLHQSIRKRFALPAAADVARICELR